MMMMIMMIIIIIKAGRGARVTTHLQLEPRLKASAAKPYPAPTYLHAWTKEIVPFLTFAGWRVRILTG